MNKEHSNAEQRVYDLYMEFRRTPITSCQSTADDLDKVLTTCTRLRGKIKTLNRRLLKVKAENRRLRKLLDGLKSIEIED